MTPAIKLDKEGKLRLSEADVTEQVCQFLGAEGWRGYRMNVGGMENTPGNYVRFGETGVPDWLFIRYGAAPTAMDNAAQYRVRADVLWIEMKAPNKKPEPHQLAWHEAERARGALVKVVDHFETFRDWYRGVFK